MERFMFGEWSRSAPEGVGPFICPTSRYGYENQANSFELEFNAGEVEAGFLAVWALK